MPDGFEGFQQHILSSGWLRRPEKGSKGGFKKYQKLEYNQRECLLDSYFSNLAR
jgi:hypothetical protein